MPVIQIKRIYDPPENTDGFRILVDRLWPRGIKKEAANIDVWLKAVAPSNNLRKWFNHETDKWEKFSEAYQLELKNSEAMKELIQYVKPPKRVTLLYAAKDEEHNQAIVLKKFLESTFKK